MIETSRDAFTGEVIIQDLAVLRKFGQLLAFDYFEEDAKVFELYEQSAFVNFGKAFTTSDLSHLLKKYSKQLVGEDFGMRDWRHICISFKRTRIPAIAKLLDNHDSLEAAQAGHSRAIENRIYGVAEDYMEGTPQDILADFLKASTRWHEDLHLVPGEL